jgi:hypothetical protein
LSPDSIVAGDLVVLDASRRNRNFENPRRRVRAPYQRDARDAAEREIL